MTWEEWKYSEYNADNLISLDSSSYVYKNIDENGQLIKITLYTNDYVLVLKNDYIIDNKSYIFIAPGGGN